MTEEDQVENYLIFDRVVQGKVEQHFGTTLIIPAYNEEKRIGHFLSSLVSILPESSEIIVVFDGNDGTPEVIKSFGNRIKLIQFPRRLGKGAAIIEGFKRATGEVVGFVDADGAIPSSEVFRLSKMVSEDVPCVIGSRWVRNAKIISQEPLLNVIAGRAFHYLNYLVLGLRVKDTQCGLKFFHKSILDRILPEVTLTNRMIDVALLYHIELLRKNISEVGIKWSHRPGTKLPILRVIPIMFALLIGLRLLNSHRLKKRFKFLSKAYSDINFV